MAAVYNTSNLISGSSMLWAAVVAGTLFAQSMIFDGVNQPL